MWGDDDLDGRARLQRLFVYDEVEPDRFRYRAHRSSMPRLYGGQVISQALSAAQRTVATGRVAHSCHAYFVRPGDRDADIDFVVRRDSDGRSFSARRVEAMQGDRLILSLSASMHDLEPGGAHQFAMPDVPAPDTLVDQRVIMDALGDRLSPRHQSFWLRDTGFDMRAVEPFVSFDPPAQPAVRHFWIRLRDRIGDDPAEHQRLFAFISDLYVMHTGLLPLGIGWADRRLQDASLDHAIWFHDRFRVDDWLLYALDSPRAGGARTVGRGLVYRQDGTLVASVVQEGLIRLLDEAKY
ncbi:acyl-CoA thioesterase-2 [Sphingomonas jejuensis]|uniref:Acyl-CoA thioesterase-2 n=1 Tax=Sphingomonas jejuensis TaxID=904715 RepID=A0ABX0XMK9_9SPHN|nr:acyl-CoA thioesterase-2 [Sphingomonas jejuensis]